MSIFEVLSSNVSLKEKKNKINEVKKIPYDILNCIDLFEFDVFYYLLKKINHINDIIFIFEILNIRNINNENNQRILLLIIHYRFHSDTRTHLNLGKKTLLTQMVKYGNKEVVEYIIENYNIDVDVDRITEILNDHNYLMGNYNQQKGIIDNMTNKIFIKELINNKIKKI